MRAVIYLRVSTREQVEKGEGEEGFSIPAQREACVRHIADAGGELVDEYVDRGESARSADRPALQQMLARIAEDSDVDAVIVHKVDRLARNLEDHVAIRALLRRRGVALVSVSENLEETASGRLVEGIHALMAEFYSANLANEIKKGMGQKAKQGGYPHRAPLGYLNVRELIGGRQVAHIVPDPERAALVTEAFADYATGEWTLERLAAEMGHRGLTNRGRVDYPQKPLGVSGLASLLANPAYTGVVHWDGVTYPGVHEPLVASETFQRVQELLTARAARGTRERRHHHYLKGLLVCGVCGRRLSIQRSKGTYTYFYCLGQKDRRYPTGCRESYVAADALEAEIEDLYAHVEVPTSWADGLEAVLAEEIAARNAANRTERDAIVRRRERTDGERRKLLDAYYAGAVDVATLRTEQERIAGDARTIEARLATLDASLEDWQDLIGTALRFSTNCARTYRRADDRTRKAFNAAVLEEVRVRDGHVVEAAYQAPFDLLFAMPKFEYGDIVEAAGLEQRSVVRGLEVRCNEEAATHLELAASTPLLYLERLRLAAGEPLAIDQAWFPAMLAAPLLEVDFTHTGFYDELASRTGIRLTGGHEQLHAVMPTKAERLLLGLGPTVAAFAIDRLGYVRNEPVEWRHTLVRGDRFSVVAAFSAGAGYRLDLSAESIEG